MVQLLAWGCSSLEVDDYFWLSPVWSRQLAIFEQFLIQGQVNLHQVSQSDHTRYLYIIVLRSPVIYLYLQFCYCLVFSLEYSYCDNTPSLTKAMSSCMASNFWTTSAKLSAWGSFMSSSSFKVTFLSILFWWASPRSSGLRASVCLSRPARQSLQFNWS